MESAEAGERYQLTQLKEQLAEALGDDGPSYWAALRDFVHGKLNRQEFDFYAYMYLSGEKAALHNRFILATIHNAQSGQAPPEGERSAGFEGRRKRRFDGDERAGGSGSGDESRKSRRSIKALLEDPKWRYVKELVKSLNKNERRAIKALLKRPGLTPEEAQAAIRSVKPVVLPMPASALPQSYAMDIAKGITAPLVYDTKSMPDIESLSYRMVAIALEKGLSGGVTRESGELLLYALDYHLKNIVSDMIYKIRSNRALGIPVSSAVAVPPMAASTVVAAAAAAPTAAAHPGALQRPTTGGLRLRDRLYNSKTTLHLSDLVFSLEISPSTTVEPPLCLERWGNLLANQVLAESATGGDDEPHIVPSSGDGAGAQPEGQDDDDDGAVDHGDAAPHADGDSDDGSKRRRKARRLRARYERWFGPYVSAPHGHGGGSGGGGATSE
ncbi:hypothetical protein LPJ61_000839 [Coemansia biformis]|uniref:Transcriptional regulator of RNA polII, SAGA, subunit-domain-containing protein n=1 Tax=Coemansia biformis TaxID=1286918 RepID=A0A9W8D185_9FUNG|nr:hypothetical protein LPJ61_000839 [Coemansia biformis]